MTYRLFSIAGMGDILRRPSLGKSLKQRLPQRWIAVDFEGAFDPPTRRFALSRVWQIAKIILVTPNLSTDRSGAAPQCFGNFAPRYSAF